MASHVTNIGYTMTTSRFSAYTPRGRSLSGVYTKPTSGKSITDLYQGEGGAKANRGV